MGFVVEGIDHVALAVSAQQTSADFYRDVLGLEREFADQWGDTPIVLAAHRITARRTRSTSRTRTG